MAIVTIGLSVLNLKKNKTYTTKNSGLAVEILNIAYSNIEYYKVKVAIKNKLYSERVYEIKNYKLYKDKIQHWEEM